MSTQPQERHVRVCPVHMTEVEERGSALVCPRGEHAVSHFKVLDPTKGTVVYDVPTDGDDHRGGIIAVMRRFRPVPKANEWKPDEQEVK